MSNIIKRFMKEESGATMVEYAVLVALIAVAVIATVVLLGTAIDEKFDQVQRCIASSGTDCAAAAPAP